MEFRAEELTAEAAYRLLVGCVVPRPIAWITTLSGNGVINAAPFSAFTFVSNKPPMVAVSIGRKAGVRKDTARNIESSCEFVVNIGNVHLLDKVHLSAQEFPENVSEIVELQIETLASKRVMPPRIALAPVSLECRLHKALELGAMGTELFIGEVVVFHVQDELLRDGKIETVELQPICRLGGPHYASLGEIVTMQTIGVTPK